MMHCNKICWKRGNTPDELHEMLRTLAEEYPVIEGDGCNGLNVTFVKATEPGISSVSTDGENATVEYWHISQASRGIGTLLAGLEAGGKTEYRTLGIMLDCSRNAVMKVDCLKKWLRRLALMGYNMVQLYTEDTYKLPGEPFFGYLRGAYTLDEMKEIDAYAARLGIEMIACIQTLGHLAQILQWGHYNNVKDTGQVMLVDEPKTYALIDKMLAFWSEAFSSRRIHVGMDETHDLGRGRFMDKFGYERGFDIFNRHFAKVKEMCGKYNYRPMIWSDMYFRMGNDTYDYYRKDTVIPDDVKAAIPKDIDLVYWDYYHKDKEFYSEWIKRHRDLGYEPPMGSGVWTWARFWYDHNLTKATVEPCLKACTEQKLNEVFFTMWGDDGAYCEYNSSLAGLCYAAELAYGSDENPEVLEKRFRVLGGASYAAYTRAGDIQLENIFEDQISAAQLMWDDPIYGIVERNLKSKDPQVMNKILSAYKSLKNDLEAQLNDDSGNLVHAVRIVDALIAKIEFRRELLDAYSVNQSRLGMEWIKGELVYEVIEKLEALLDSMRSQWMERNKPFGFETLQIRFCGLIGRYKEIAVRLEELLEGKIDSIPELDEEAEADFSPLTIVYRTIAVPSAIF